MCSHLGNSGRGPTQRVGQLALAIPTTLNIAQGPLIHLSSRSPGPIGAQPTIVTNQLTKSQIMGSSGGGLWFGSFNSILVEIGYEMLTTTTTTHVFPYQMHLLIFDEAMLNNFNHSLGECNILCIWDELVVMWNWKIFNN